MNINLDFTIAAHTITILYDIHIMLYKKKYYKKIYINNTYSYNILTIWPDFF